MTSIELKRLARRIARLEQNQANMSKPQLAYSSIENGNIKSYEGDDLKMSIGLQDDGSSTMRFFDGPIPPVPAGFTALADGPLIQGTWDGTFEDGAQATYDLAYLEVAATLVDDDSRVSFATITAKEGASAALVANQSGLWAVAVRSVSQAGKKSEFASAGTVEVKLVDLAGAIEAVQDSANGKNKVHYSVRPPTPEDPGIFDDTWFVGQVGRPNDVVEATNLATNPSFEGGVSGWTQSNATAPLTSSATFVDRMSGSVGSSNGLLTIASGHASPYASARIGDTEKIQATPGTWVAVRAWAATEQTGEQLRVQVRVGASGEGYDYFSTPFSTAGFYAGRTMLVSFQVPAGKTEFRPEVQLYSGSSSVNLQAGKRMWIDGVNIVSADSEEKVRSLAGGYFDGDTPSGATVNESHYRWTGTPHASTSEKYLPALDIGDSDNWNVIEQYRHDGTGWVKVELSHYVFSTVDLGKATVGELDGIRIMARTMSSDVFTGTAFEGYIFKGTTFQTTNGSEFSDRGLFMYDLDGNPRIQAPVDGSDFTINAEIVARSLTSTGRASFLAEDNRIEPGAGLVLAAGVGDPPSPPVVSTYYPTIPAPAIPEGYACTGFGYTGGHFYRILDNTTAGENDRMQKISPDGTVVSEWEFLYNTLNGMTAIGDELFLLGHEEGKGGEHKRHVRVYSTSGQYRRQWEYTSYGTGTYQPGIGKDDAGNVLIAQCWVTGELSWRAYNPTTGALISQVDTNDNTKSGINGIYVGAADFGVRRAVIAKAHEGAGYRQFPVFSLSTHKYVPAESWTSAGRAEPMGLAWDGSKWFSINSGGTISEYSTLNTGDDSSDWWAVYRWAKDVDSDLTIDLSSRISPPARFAWPRRARLKITAPNLPQGAGEIAPSLAYKTSTPTRTDFHTPSWWSVTGEPSAYYYELSEFWYSEPSPGDENNFPDGTPSVLSAASGLFEVKGDGSGHWGPLTFNPDGTMSSSAVPDWTPITTFESGFGPQEWGDVPAYRIWPDGKVEWTGVVAGNIPSGNGVPILTIPTDARPGRPKDKVGATSGTNPGTARLEFGPLADPTKLYAFGATVARTWVSIDEIYYYLT